MEESRAVGLIFASAGFTRLRHLFVYYEIYYVAYKPIALPCISCMFIKMKFIHCHSCVMFAMKSISICND